MTVITPTNSVLSPPLSTGVNTGPEEVAVSPLTGNVYVTDQLGTVHVFSSGNAPEPSIPVSQGGPQEVAVSPVTGRGLRRQ